MRNLILALGLATIFSVSGPASAQTAKIEKTGSGPRSPFLLLPGYKITIVGGDAGGGTVWKTGGVSIDFGWGMYVGNAADSIEKDQVSWREVQTAKGHEIVCVYSKSGEFVISFRGGSDAPANFRAKIRNGRDMAEMLLMVLTFEPHQGYPVDPVDVAPPPTKPK